MRIKVFSGTDRTGQQLSSVLELQMVRLTHGPDASKREYAHAGYDRFRVSLPKRMKGRFNLKSFFWPLAGSDSCSNWTN